MYDNNISCLRACFSFWTEICSFWLILYWCYLRMYAIGKGSDKTCTTLRYSFDLLLITDQKLYKSLLKLTSGVFSFIPFWGLCQKSSLFPFNKLSFLTTSLEWFLLSAQIFLAQWGNSLLTRAMSSGTAYALWLHDIGTGFKPTSPVSSALQADSYHLSHWGSPSYIWNACLLEALSSGLQWEKSTFEIRYRNKNL